jgi:hypothetical protein
MDFDAIFFDLIQKLRLHVYNMHNIVEKPYQHCTRAKPGRLAS